jgi:hypothetical protein
MLLFREVSCDFVDRLIRPQMNTDNTDLKRTRSDSYASILGVQIRVIRVHLWPDKTIH